VARAGAAGLSAIALTDHDTLDGVLAARAAGARCGVRVVSGCEFSVAAEWGEMHVLGYFLPVGDLRLERFLQQQRGERALRGEEIVRKLQGLGLAVEMNDVLVEAAGGAVGRPHVARALVRLGHSTSLDEAFDRYVGWGRPGFVGKQLPTFGEVAELVRGVGGLLSAAHLKDRGSRTLLRKLKDQGLDAVETRHPSHSGDTRARLTDHAVALDLLRTGGSDWHGDGATPTARGAMGSQSVPLEWLELLDAQGERNREPAGSAPSQP
jgi:predicted metal-dependent phosphoesterase TrpH